MRTAGWSALVLLALAGTIHADPIYQISLDAAGGLSAFSFSFSAPTFVTAGQSLTFTPFTITDGTNTWQMVNGLAGSVVASNGTFGCLLFDTGGSSGIDSTCGFGVGIGSTSDAAFAIFMSGGLPTSTGVDTIAGGTGFFNFSGGQRVPSFTGTVNITSTVPELPSIEMLGISLAVAAWRLH